MHYNFCDTIVLTYLIYCQTLCFVALYVYNTGFLYTSILCTTKLLHVYFSFKLSLTDHDFCYVLVGFLWYLLWPICSRMKENYLKDGHSSVFIIVFNILLCNLVHELPQHHCYIMLINPPMAMENWGCTCIMLKIRIPQLWAKPWLQAKKN